MTLPAFLPDDERPNPAAIAEIVNAHRRLDGLAVPRRFNGRPCTLDERMAFLVSAADNASTRAALAALSGV